MGHSLNTYSPSDVIVSLAGLHTIVGYADGPFIRIVKETKPFEKARAMNGEVSRIYSEEEVFRVEITLMQSSPSNNVLSMLYNIDRASRVGKFPLFIKDTRGQTTFLSATTWIEQIPDVVFGTNLSTYTWVFGCSDAAIMIAGNDDTSVVEQSLMIASSTLPILADYLP